MHLILALCWTVIFVMIVLAYLLRNLPSGYLLMMLTGLAALVVWHVHPLVSKPSDLSSAYVFSLFVYCLPALTAITGCGLLLHDYRVWRSRHKRR